MMCLRKQVEIVKPIGSRDMKLTLANYLGSSTLWWSWAINLMGNLSSSKGVSGHANIVISLIEVIILIQRKPSICTVLILSSCKTTFSLKMCMTRSMKGSHLNWQLLNAKAILVRMVVLVIVKWKGYLMK